MLLILLFVGQLKAQTYYKDVATIFYQRCASCHNQNSHAFSLLGYTHVNTHLTTIQSSLNSGSMPLWAPDTTFRRFRHEHIITQVEKSAILNWISGGALMGDTTQAPPEPVFSRYQLPGTPDLELQIPNFTSNAGATDAHDCFALPTGLSQDRIIRAIEVVPGNAGIVHHITIAIDSTGTQGSNLNGNCYLSAGDYNIGAYTPGAAPIVFPASGPLRSGIRLKARSNIILQIHYAQGTAGSTDSSKIRLYFYPLGATAIRPVKILAARNTVFSLPANQVSVVSAQYPPGGNAISSPVALLGCYPHSHKLCTHVVDFAASQTDTIPLIRINNWNPDWQGWYTYKRPLKITPGHIIYSKHLYDNTANNPNNPFNPPQTVNYGQTGNDEMLIDFYQYLDYQAGDELLNMDSVLTADSSFTTSFALPNHKAFKVSTFPNPFQKSTTIQYELEEPCFVSLDIFNTTGIRVKQLMNGYQTQGMYSAVWNCNDPAEPNLPPGLYFYTLRCGSQLHTGKLMLGSKPN